MRVCFISLSSYAYFDPDSGVTAGGAQRQLYLLSQELKDEFDVHFIVGDYGQPRTEQKDGITLHRAYSPDPSSGPLGGLRQTVSLIRAMNRANAEVYIYRGYPKKAAVTFVLTRLLRAKWVYHVADDSHVDIQSLSSPWRRLFGKALKDASSIVAQTPYQRDALADHFGVNATVIPNGYPETNNLASFEDRDYFLWVGRIAKEQKRPHLFLDLAEACPDQQFRLIGPRNDRNQYHERITERAASLPNVEDFEGVDPNAIHDHYRDAIALVNTSSHEGFPNTFLEAWRFATPVLSLEIEPNRFIGDEVPGHAGGDMDELVRLVKEYGGDARARRASGEPAHQYFQENLRMGAVASRYERLLQNIR